MSVKLKIPVCAFWREALFCPVDFDVVSNLFLLRPVNTMRLVSYDSFVLLCWNQGNDLWLSEFGSSCVQAKTKLFQPSVYHHTYRFCKSWPDLWKVHSLRSEQVFNWIEWKTCSEFSELISLLYSKRVTILKGFLWTIWFTGQCNWFHNNQVIQSVWQTGVANATSWVFWESLISDLYPKWLLGNIKYFVSLKLKSLKLNRFDQIIALSKNWPPVN